jgi:NAD(P)-dependent dehydrogenase (short-subunit alcohol dehydrogenase family)
MSFADAGSWFSADSVLELIRGNHGEWVSCHLICPSVDRDYRPRGLSSYSISKAAALNMTQSLRALLAGQGVTVHTVVLGPIDTDMNRGFEIPKASPSPQRSASSMGWREGKKKSLPDSPPLQQRLQSLQETTAKSSQFFALRMFGAIATDAPIRTKPKVRVVYER